jgi:O-antigen ligase
LTSYFHLIGFQSYLLLYGRPKGLFKDPNVYGPYLVPIAVMAVTGCLPIGSRFWQACMAVVASMGIALSYSRACWINYVVSLALFVVLDLLLPSRSPDAHSISLSRVFLFGAGALLAGFAILQVPSVQTMLAVRLGQNGMHDYDQTRFQTQRMAVQAAIDHPLGIGPGQSEATFKYATHSSYMRVLSENGLFGLCCFVGFALASVVQAVRKACLSETSAWRGLFVASAACICGQLINSGVVDTVHWRHLWILLALPWIPARVWSSSEDLEPSTYVSDRRRTQ